MLTEKPIKDWDFQDLVKHSTWEIISGITQGHALKSLVHQVLNTALLWKSEKDKAIP